MATAYSSESKNGKSAGAASLEQQILESRLSREPVETTLKTDQRVIARVTDGIYRQPGSALRELISNAYDADATNVYIETDAPRFGTIKIWDDGNGMSPKVLARLLEHIGGSSKRTHEGSEIGVASPTDSTQSKSGRKLIGKIGIGLFSVAQLTHKFQIITKVKGESYRTIASIAMKTYTEDDLNNLDEKTEFESGKVKIWSEAAEDKDAHGTTVILSDLRPQARDTLRSRDIWATIKESVEGSEELNVIQPPRYHIGHVEPETGELITDTASVPWEMEDEPDIKFKKLVDCVWNEVGKSNPNPKLADMFDYYLQMIWNLSLSAPLPYVDAHPFDTKFEDAVLSFELQNMAKGAAKQIDFGKKHTLREASSLSSGANRSEFNVYLDGLKLYRPIRFTDLPKTSHSLQNSLIFVGKCRQEFSGIAREISSGPLSFEAYLFWTPKIAPREHRGSLVRINGASGTLFDIGFMRYQTSEINRLNQITCEIFVSEGLDGALNIDRESFNFAHPHYVYLSRWLHSALRQLSNTQKKVASASREELRSSKTDSTLGRLQEVVKKEWNLIGNDPDETPPPVLFESRTEKGSARAAAVHGAYSFNREMVLSALQGRRRTASSEAENKIFEERLKAIAQLLAAYGVFDSMNNAKQERLLRGIADILATEAEQ